MLKHTHKIITSSFVDKRNGMIYLPKKFNEMRDF